MCCLIDPSALHALYREFLWFYYQTKCYTLLWAVAMSGTPDVPNPPEKFACWPLIA